MVVGHGAPQLIAVGGGGSRGCDVVRLLRVLHLFWALGGSIGLASSAGRYLAGRRPASFVIFGLYGTALLLVIGILTIAVTQSPRAARRLRRAVTLLLAVVGVVLVLRGLALRYFSPRTPPGFAPMWAP
jgi:hypothetical protein